MTYLSTNNYTYRYIAFLANSYTLIILGVLNKQLEGNTLRYPRFKLMRMLCWLYSIFTNIRHVSVKYAFGDIVSTGYLENDFI